MFVIYFLLWTFMLYWVHRIGHKIPYLRSIHWDHHKFINKHKTSWHWNNIFLFNDTWTSTLDLWMTEVIPTIIFCIIIGQWWIFILFYIWAALIQERVEHNTEINIMLFTCGKWHRLHHKFQNKNFSLFFPIWDLIFGTYIKVT